MDIMFRYHVKFPWFNEKYNPAMPFVNLRRRVRREGWDGLIDKFIRELQDGQHDPVAEIEAASARDNKPVTNNEPIYEEVLQADSDEKDEHGNDRDGEPISPAQNGENGDDTAIDPTTIVGDTTSLETSEKPDLKNRIQPFSKDDRREDEVMVEPDGNQVLIRTIPPDIGRVKLEKVVSHSPASLDVY